MEAATWAVLIAGAALALDMIFRLFGGGWNLSSKLSHTEGTLRSAFEDSVRDIENNQRAAAHEFGETVAALKEHVRQVEFHVRDKYILKDDFILMMKSHDELLRLNFENITQRLDRIEKQLDHKS